MSEELKPCPFCGGEAERITLVDAENFGGDVISCKKCECCTRVVFGEKEGLVESWNRRAELSAIKAGQGEAVELAVWYGAMPESNGKSNYTAILHRKGVDLLHGCIITLDRSEHHDRVRYEADRARFLIGELSEEPCILDYDADAHSGYTSQPSDPGTVPVRRELLAMALSHPATPDEMLDKAKATEELRALLAQSEGVKR